MINTAESSERTISVELMNPYTATWQQECHWEIIDEAETGGITLNPNGNTALISAHKSGLYRVQVSNDGTEYPLRDDDEVIRFFADVWASGDAESIAQAVLSHQAFWSGRDLTEIPGLKDAVAGYLKDMETRDIKDIIKEIIH